MRKIFTARTLRAVLAGAAGGAANGFFGSGGGLLSVPALESGGLETKKAHATSLAIMLPLSVVSAAVYMKNGSLDLREAARYLPDGLAGVIVGSAALKKASPLLVKRLFAAVMIYFGVRMIIR